LNKVFNRDNAGFAGLQWFFWSVYCTVIPFLVIYLKTKGYTEVQTGAIMAAISLTSIIGQPFWGNYCDRKHSIRNVLIGCLLVAGIVALLIPVFYKSFVIVIIIALIISFTENSVYTIIDSWTIQIAVKKPWLNYGITRGLGSLGYAVTAVALGAMLDRYGYGLMFPVHFVVILFFIGFCFYVGWCNKSAKGMPTFDQKRAETPKMSLKGSGRFVWFVISSLLVFIGCRALMTFYPILLVQLGGNNSDLGISYFVAAASEVPILFLANRLMKKFRDTALIATSMFFFIVRISLTIFATSIPALILLQATEGLSYGLFLCASTYYVIRISPVGLSSTFLTIAASFYAGVGGIIGSFGGGLIIDLYGMYAMLWVGTGITVLGLLIFLISSAVRYNTQNFEEQQLLESLK
jgi:PPP family 3-phenylpropionic acid transporter